MEAGRATGRAGVAIDRAGAESPLVLAIDIGTSWVRADVFDRLGRLVEGTRARRAHELLSTPDGGSEADPEELVALVTACLAEVMDGFGGEVAGVATSSLVGNVVGLDGDGRPVTPLVTYADTRAAGEAERLRREVDPEAVRQRTGCPLHPAYLPAQLRWLARARPSAFGRVRRWASIGDLLHQRLLGRSMVGFSVASWWGLLDRRSLEWDPEMLAAADLDRQRLPELGDSNRPLGRLRNEYRRRWPGLAGAAWFPAVGDGAAANVGSGCAVPERVALTIGTTSALRAVLPGAPATVPVGLWCYRVDGRRSLLGGALSEGGNVYAWLKRTLRLRETGLEDSALEADLEALQPDGHGLTILPFLSGERSPGWASKARGTLHGLTPATTPVEIIRAGLEAVAYRLGAVFHLLEPALPGTAEVVGSGGALLRSPVWQQIVADVLGRPLAVSRVEEASSRGAALLALEALGALEDAGQAPAFLGERLEPDPARHRRYRAAMERQQELYRRLVESM